jgi:hypothetical protein
MLVPVEVGANQVEIRFVRTWDRALGGWISIVTLFTVAGCAVRTWQRRTK